MRSLCLVLATAVAAAQLNVRDAAFVVRGHKVSVLSKQGCFTVAGSRCEAFKHNGRGDDAALSSPEGLQPVTLAAPPMRLEASLNQDLMIIPMYANCAGRAGLWHLLVECVATIVEEFRRATQRLPGRDRDAALLFLDKRHIGTGASVCAFNASVERYRWVLEALFKGGVYPSLACYAHANGDLVYHSVMSALDMSGSAESS